MASDDRHDATATAAAVRAAVAALYTSPDPATRSAADGYLQAFLRGEHAWTVSLGLLRHHGADIAGGEGGGTDGMRTVAGGGSTLTSLEALFCARALHVLLRRSVVKSEKTQKSHAVLDDADWVEMRETLLSMAWRFAFLNVVGSVGSVGGGSGSQTTGPHVTSLAPPRTVLTQLSLAIAALACKMHCWDANDVVGDLVRYFLPADVHAVPPSVVAFASRVEGGGSNPGGGGGGQPPCVQLSPRGAAAAAHAGVSCLLQILSVLPDECTSNQLSIHPARRAAVVEASRAAACAVVFPALDRLASKVGADPHAQASLMCALGAWAAFEPAAAGSCPSVTLGAALGLLCDANQRTPTHAPSGVTVEAAVTAATNALVAAVHRPERREALGEALRALRGRCGAGSIGSIDPVRARAVEVVASVAVRAAGAPPALDPAPPDPLGTGANAAPDREYVPYKQFARMKRERKRAEQREGVNHSLRSPALASADLEVLCFSLDALAEAMGAGGVSPAAALEPWTVMREDVEAAGGGGGRRTKNIGDGRPAFEAPPQLMACAARAAAAAARWVVCVDTSADASDDGGVYAADASDDGSLRDERDELGEGLRDVATTVGADDFLRVVVEGLVASERDGASAHEGWIYALFATARLVSTSPRAAPAVEAAATALGRISMSTHKSGTPTTTTREGAELAMWATAGLARALSAQPPRVLLAALRAVVSGLASDDHGVARGACVAAMRACETCASTLASTVGVCAADASAFVDRLAEVYRAGGPAAPPVGALRRGREPTTTILARALAAVARAREPPAAAEAATAALAEASIAAIGRALAGLAEAAGRMSPPEGGPHGGAQGVPVHYVGALADATRAVAAAVEESRVTTEACLLARRRAAEEEHASGSSSLSPAGAFLSGVLSPVVAEVTRGAHLAARAFRACGAEAAVEAVEEVTAATAALLRAVVASCAAHDLRGVGLAVRLAAAGYLQDPAGSAPLLSVLVTALAEVGDARLPSESEGAWVGSSGFCSVGEVACATLEAAYGAHLSTDVAVSTLTRATLRAGCPAMAAACDRVAMAALCALRENTSGDAAVAALAFASDVLVAPYALAPGRYAPTRCVDATTAARNTHPGMGRLASTMSDTSGARVRRTEPAWAAEAPAAAPLAEGMHRTLVGAGAGAALVRALLECANGMMPPNLVTDVACAMFSAWAAGGDDAFAPLLTGALGTEPDGFPRKGTTAEQKAEFRDQLLLLAPAAEEGPSGGDGRKAVKYDLRRFKRALKAFCGGKKVLNKPW